MDLVVTHKLQNLRADNRYSGKTKSGRHNKTVNSQRKLNSATPYGYAGFTDLTFDVAMGVPIFNAQWAAAVSVVFCNKQALSTLNTLGYLWAKPLVTERRRNEQAADLTLRSVKELMSVTHLDPRFINTLNHIPSVLPTIPPQYLVGGGAKTHSGTASDKSEIKGSEDAQGPANRVLGLGILAASAVSLALLTKSSEAFNVDV